MFGVDVGSIPCGFGASTTTQGLHLVESSALGFQPTSQILTDKCGGNGMMMDPYPHPQHMKVHGKHSMWVWSLNHCTRASFGAKQ